MEKHPAPHVGPPLRPTESDSTEIRRLILLSHRQDSKFKPEGETSWKPHPIGVSVTILLVELGFLPF